MPRSHGPCSAERRAGRSQALRRQERGFFTGSDWLDLALTRRSDGLRQEAIRGRRHPRRRSRLAVRDPGGRDGESIASLVFDVAGVPLDPSKLDRVMFAEGEQSLPQLPVRHGLPRPAPAPCAPPACPSLRDAVHDVCGITEERDGAPLLQRLEGLDGRHQLHPIVRRSAKPPGDLATMLAELEDGAVSARSRVASARPVCVHDDRLQPLPTSYPSSAAAPRSATEHM